MKLSPAHKIKEIGDARSLWKLDAATGAGTLTEVVILMVTGRAFE